jgi:hypothetical protein
MQLVNVVDAAGMLGLSPWTLRSWAYAGRVSSVKLGGRLLFERCELERIVSEATRPAITSAKRSRKAQIVDATPQPAPAQV